MPQDSTPQETSFLVLYRGPSVEAATPVAFTGAPDLVRRFAEEMLERQAPRARGGPIGSIDRGRREALRQIRDEVADDEAAAGEEGEGVDRE